MLSVASNSTWIGVGNMDGSGQSLRLVRTTPTSLPYPSASRTAENRPCAILDARSRWAVGSLF